MSHDTFTPPEEWDLWCRSTQALLRSDHFKKFLHIYNLHTAGTSANKENVSVEDVLRDRNLRNRMRAFFRDQIQLRLVGAKQAEAVVKISMMIDSAVAILDVRNSKIRSGEIMEGDDEHRKLLQRSFEAR